MGVLSEEHATSYVEGGGSVCPYCGGSDLTGLELVVEDGYVYRLVICGSCNSSWEDAYRLVGIYLEATGTLHARGREPETGASPTGRPAQ